MTSYFFQRTTPSGTGHRPSNLATQKEAPGTAGIQPGDSCRSGCGKIALLAVECKGFATGICDQVGGFPFSNLCEVRDTQGSRKSEIRSLLSRSTPKIHVANGRVL